MNLESLADSLKIGNKLFWKYVSVTENEPDDVSKIDESELIKQSALLRKTLLYKVFLNYFRPELHNRENIPSNGNALFVGNHSGLLGWDAMSFMDTAQNASGRVVFVLSERFLKVIPPLYKFIKDFGCISGKPKVALELLNLGKLVAVYPGGAEEATKPFYKRYKVERQHGFEGCGYIRMALAANAPIIPVATIGAENAHIVLAELRPALDRALDKVECMPGALRRASRKARRVIGLFPVLPLPLNILPMPAKIDIYVGKSLNLSGCYSGFSLEEYGFLRSRETRLAPAESRRLEYINCRLSGLSEIVREELQAFINRMRK